MGGEEFPYPGLTYLILRIASSTHSLTEEDEAIFARFSTVRNSIDYAVSDSADLIIMHARTSCPGVKPAMKNLAVFLKYS